MTLRTGCIGIVLIGLLSVPAVGQVAAMAPPPAAAEPTEAQAMQQLAQGDVDPVALMRQMGADEGEILFIQLLSQASGPKTNLRRLCAPDLGAFFPLTPSRGGTILGS